MKKLATVIALLCAAPALAAPKAHDGTLHVPFVVCGFLSGDTTCSSVIEWTYKGPDTVCVVETQGLTNAYSIACGTKAGSAQSLRLPPNSSFTYSLVNSDGTIITTATVQTPPLP